MELKRFDLVSPLSPVWFISINKNFRTIFWKSWIHFLVYLTVDFWRRKTYITNHDLYSFKIFITKVELIIPVWSIWNKIPCGRALCKSWIPRSLEYSLWYLERIFDFCVGKIVGRISRNRLKTSLSDLIFITVGQRRDSRTTQCALVRTWVSHQLAPGPKYKSERWTF